MRFIVLMLLLAVITIATPVACEEAGDFFKLTQEAIKVLYAFSPGENSEIAFFQKLSDNLKESGKEVIKVTLITENGKNITFKYNLNEYSAEIIENEKEAKGLYPIRATYWERTRFFKLSVANVDYNFVLDSESLLFSSSHAFGSLPKLE